MRARRQSIHSTRRRTTVRAKAAGPLTDRLSGLDNIRDNPGNLAGRYYVPEGLRGPAPLVVVLHGCTQNAALYDDGAGWSTLADRHGFILLFPEQKRANNSMLCFNWFSSHDSRRGAGEAASIRSMIEAMREVREIDAERIFVTGLSAGGAMASVMLATYPELFAGGAIIAGIAYGCANGVAEAFDCMSGRSRLDAGQLGERVRRASPHTGPWPRVQVWQGGRDRTVVSSNADAIALQWADLHELDPKPSQVDEIEGHRHRVWTDRGGRAVIEHYQIDDMAHGVPLNPGTGDGQSGKAGAHMIDVGLSSTDRIAEFFGIAGPANASRKGRNDTAPRPPRRVREDLDEAGSRPPARDAVQWMIEDALRSAGLMD